MSKRIALLFRGESKVNQKGFKELKTLKNNLSEVAKILKNYGEWTPQEFLLKDSDQIPEILKEISDDDTVEVLLFYTGHGVSQPKDRYALIGKDSKEIIFDNIINAINKFSFTKFSLIIDACHSQEVFNSIPRQDNIQAVSSVMRGLSYEYEEKAMSYFTYYFSQHVSKLVLNQNQNICLEQILNSMLEDQAYKKIKQKGLKYLAPTLTTHTQKNTIVYPHIFTEIKQTLQNHYKGNFNKFKEAVLSYTHSDKSIFGEMVKSNSFNELFILLLQNKKCISCLFQALQEEHDFLEKIEDNYCNDLKYEASKSRIVKQIVLQIELEDKKSLKKSSLKGWFKLDSNIYREIEKIEKIDFRELEDDENYRTQLPEYLSRQLQGMVYNKPLELQLILPIKLFSVEFKNLEIELKDEFGDIVFRKKELNRYFNISTRFLDNVKNYATPLKIRDWKTNSKYYKQCCHNDINKNLLHTIEQKVDITKLDGFNNNGYISVVSNHTLLEEDILLDILSYGLPFVVCPQDSEYGITDEIELIGNKVEEIKKVVFNFTRDVRDKHSIHYIHDDYYDIEFLQNDFLT